MRVQPGAILLCLSRKHLTVLLSGARLPQGAASTPAGTAPGQRAVSGTVTSTRNTCSVPLGDTDDTSAVMAPPRPPALL